jgi:endonuclease/exonuclease/phosphatase family metal-dependent hydrolase
MSLLHIRVSEGRNLLAGDNNGFSDPYVLIKLSNHKDLKSKIHYKTINPIFNADFTIPISSNDNKSILHINVLDKDKLDILNDSLGFLHFPIEDLLVKRVVSGWYQLLDGNGDKFHGSIFLTLLLDYPRDQANSKQFELERSSLIYHYQNNHSAEEKKDNNLSILCASWNVGNAKPPAVSELNHWLKPGYDLYAVGVQECKFDSSANLSNINLDECGKVWTNSLNEFFGSAYHLVKSKNLMEIRLHIYVRKHYLSRIERVRSGRESTGLGHVIGNKGGVAIGFTIDDVSICFITSHLAAHQDKSTKRNSDVAEIIRGIKLDKQNSIAVTHSYNHIIWSGDLNYRCDYAHVTEHTPTPQQFQQYLTAIEKKQYKEILATDQLTAMMKAQRVFKGFTDCDCSSFPPTFKVQRHIHPIQYKEQRAPAYCDRVLYKSMPNYSIDQTSMNSAQLILTSDHTPVMATFLLPLIQLPLSTDSTLGELSIQFSDIKSIDIQTQLEHSMSHINLMQLNMQLKFFSPLFEVPYTSSQFRVENHNKNVAATAPEWTHLPRMNSLINNKQRLRYDYITIRCCESNQTQEKIIGEGNLYLAQFVQGTGQGTQNKFDVELTLGNLPVGNLIGSINLTWSPTEFKPIPINKLQA